MFDKKAEFIHVTSEINVLSSLNDIYMTLKRVYFHSISRCVVCAQYVQIKIVGATRPLTIYISIRENCDCDNTMDGPITHTRSMNAALLNEVCWWLKFLRFDNVSIYANAITSLVQSVIVEDNPYYD